MKKNLRTASICVQGGYEPKNGEPIELPIIQSTTFKYDNSEEMAMLFDLKKEGYFYTRLQNPTNDVVAQKIAQLEGGVGAVLTSSGQAANFYAVFNICEAGDHIVTSNEIYGGTFNLFLSFLSSSDFKCVISLHEKSAKITKICTKKMHPVLNDLPCDLFKSICRPVRILSRIQSLPGIRWIRTRVRFRWMINC